MASSVNANINVVLSTQQAFSQLRALETRVSAANRNMAAVSGTAVAQQAALNKALMDGANASRLWSARVVPMATSVDQFTTSLDRGKLTLGQYTRFAASQLPGMRRVFNREFSLMNKAAERNVKQLQTQYIALGKTAQGAQQAMAFTPTTLNAHASAAQIAAQRQMMFNRMIDLGSTKLLNFGKNTQWAGRQLMVGFSIPLAMLGAAAAQAFTEIDKGSIAFKRVYGDLSTTTAEMERNLQAVKDLGAEYTKYGVKLADTIELSADVAATGAKNEDLLAATEQTLRLSTLGLMEYDEALEATIALQTAFGVSNEELSETIDFLNVVENETILTMQDMSAAIPRVAPVIRGLGGDVRDLAVLMTAMREGGVTAAEGANALKTGLARLISPTKAAKDTMEGFGISLTAMIQANRGDLMGMIQDFGTALARLDEFEQQQALEKVFGKRQYARLGALFKNIANDASQAQRTIELTAMSTEDLGSIAERELTKIEEATSTKFTKAVEQLKVSIAPIGEQFLKALTPVISFITEMAEKFNNLPEGIKNAIVVATGVIAGIGPIILMTFGLIANGVANLIKFVQLIRKGFARLRGDASVFDYMTAEQREAMVATEGLTGKVSGLTKQFLGQTEALTTLIGLLNRYSSAAAATAMAMPLGMGIGTAGRAPGRTTIVGPQSRTTVAGYQKGVVGVPGSGSGDKIPALLEPGESVVTKDATQKYSAVIAAMNSGTLPGFATGFLPEGVRLRGNEETARQKIELMGERYVQAGGAMEDFVAAAERAGSKLTKSGERVKIGMSNIVSELEAIGKSMGLKAGDVPRPEVTRLQAAHLTEDFAFDDPRVQAKLEGPGGLGKRLGEELFPGTVKGGSKLTAGIGDSLNQLLRGEGALPADFVREWGAGQEQLMPAAAAIDPSVLQSQSAVDELKLLSDNIRDRAVQVAQSAGEEKVRDGHLAEATRQVIAERQEEVAILSQSNAQEAAERQQALGALSTAAEEVGEIRQFVGTEPAQMGLDTGLLTTEGRSVVPDINNPAVIEAMGRIGIDPDEYMELPPSQREVARMKRDGTPSRSASSFGGRPKTELTDTQRAQLGVPTTEVIQDAAEQAVLDANDEFADASNQAIGAQSPATEGTKSVDMYTEGMEVGVQQNIPEIQKQGQITGETYDQAVKRAIQDGGEVPPLPPSQAPPTPAGDPDGFAARNAAAVSAQIMEAEAITPMKEQMGRVRDAARASVSDIRRSLSESGKAFREIPNFVKTSAYQIKEAFKSMGPMIKQIAGPYVKPIIDAFKFAKDTIVTNVKGVAKIVSDGFKNAATTAKNAIQNAGTKVKSAYETAALKTMMALDSVKNIPAKLKGAYETAALRVMTGLDAIKRFPQDVKRRVQGLKETLGPQARRLANQAFYRGQDAMGRIRERFNRFRAGPAAAGAALREGAVGSAARALIPDKSFDKIQGAAQKLQSAAESGRQFVKNASKQIVDSAKQFSQSVVRVGNDIAKKVQNAANTVKTRVTEAGNAIKNRVMESANSFKNAAMAAGAALREGSIRDAARALTPDALSARLKAAVDTMRNAGKFIGDKVRDAGSRLVKAGQNLSNSLKAAGAALREGSFRDAARALTPDRMRAAIGNAVNTIKTIPAIIKGNTIAAFEIGKAAIVNGFNSARTAITNAGIFLKDTIVVNVKGALDIAKNAILTSAQNITNTVKNGLNIAKTKLVTEFNRVSGIVKTQGPLIAQSFKNAMSGIKAAAGSARTEMVKAGKNAGSALLSAGKSVATLVTESGKLLATSIRGAAAGVGGYLRGGVDESGRTRGQRMAGAGNTAMMGLMGVSMAASFAGGELGEMAQKIMPVTMGLMSLQMILPMLANPLGLAVLAIGALAGAAVYGQSQIRKLAKNAAEVGEGLGGVTNGLKIMEEALGFTAPDSQDRLFRFSDEDKEAMQEFSGFFEGESGQNFIEELRSASSEERYQKVANMLAQGIASGADPEKAEKFGMAIANELGDALLNSNIARDFAKGVFESGSEALIQLEKRRIEEFAPGRVLASSITSVSGQTVGSMGGVGDVLDSIASVIPGITTVNEVAAEIGGEGLGFALKSLDNLINAEAVLTEERRNGLISAEEYGDRLEEINLLQSGATFAIRDAIDLLGPKAPNIKPVFEERLKAAGFDDRRVGEVLSQIAPEDLSVKIFDKAYSELDFAQKNFISEVFARTITGLTPENYGNRFADIEDTWKAISEDAVEAIREGALGAEGSKVGGVNIQDMFNRQELQDWLQYNFGDALQAQGLTAQGGAQNIMAAGQGLTEVGTDFFEVQAALQRFTDPSNVANIVASTNEIIRLGDALVKLSDFPKIDIELFIQDPEFDPQKLATELERIASIRFDKDTFGKDFKDIEEIVFNALPDPQEWANVMEGMGVPVEEFFDKYKGAAQDVGQEISNLPGDVKEAFDEAGNLRPEIALNVVTNLLGGVVDNPGQMANRIIDSLPELNPLQLMIMVSLGGEGAALFADSNFRKAALTGENIEYDQYVPGVGLLSRTTGFTEEQLSLGGLAFGAGGQGPGGVEEEEEDTTKPSGGSSKEEESAAEKLSASIMSRLKLYTNVGKIAGLLKGQKDKVADALSKLQFEGSLADKLRKMNLSDSLIAELLAEGYESIEEIIDEIGKKGLQKLSLADIAARRGEMAEESGTEARQTRRQARAAGILSGGPRGYFAGQPQDQALVDRISGDPAKAEMLVQLQNNINKGVKGSKKAMDEFIESEKEAVRQAERLQQATDPVAYQISQIDEARQDQLNDFARKEALFAQAFGDIERQYQPTIKNLEKQIRLTQDKIDAVNEEIEALRKLNQADQRRIRSLNRQKEMLSRQMEVLQRQNEMDKRRVDQLKREDDIRSRTAQSIEKELQAMSLQEDKIRKAYDERFKALDKIAQVNDYILDQQNQQISLSRAISEGDVYAATEAAMQMRAASAQFAQQQTRSGMEAAMESQVEGLRTEGGLTREQAEERIRQIQEQSYQTQLLIRDIEDKIYERNLQMVPLKDQQYQLDLQIRDIQDVIYNRESQILDIQTTRLDPLQSQLKSQQKSLNNNQQALADAKAAVKIEGQTYDELQNQISAEKEAYDVAVALIKANGDQRRSVENVRKKWVEVTNQIAAAVRTARQLKEEAEMGAREDITEIEIAAVEGRITPDTAEVKKAEAQAQRDANLASIDEARDAEIAAALASGTEALRMAAGGMVKKSRYGMGGIVSGSSFAKGGVVLGNGSRDSVPVMLTPGEFVVRKSMVKKYGKSMMTDLNLGSYTLPRYDTGKNIEARINSSATTNNINAPVYNSYDMNFNIESTNANADEIASKVMMKIKQVQGASVRRNRV